MILDDILAHKRREVAEARSGRPLEQVKNAAGQAASPRGFRSAILQPGISIIAEIKRRSPSAGPIREQAEPAAVARNYAAAGARAISVLTDQRFFGGSGTDLVAVRDSVDLPLLRKDFVLEDYQVWEARALGADAILLIVRALDQPDLRRLRQLASDLGMDSLVEVHDEHEAGRAVLAGADLIGINNRDLTTMTVDIATTARLRPLIPHPIPVVSESGIRSAADVRALAGQGVEGILVGEALMSSDDPATALREMAKSEITA